MSTVHPHEGIWVRYQMDRLNPAQRSGWKLHLSATPDTFMALVDRSTPVLLEAQVPFKTLRGIDDVEHMNAGDYGLMQVGKCVTVYPRDEAHARDLANALRVALRGLCAGPSVPTDFSFCDDAPIYFRYGPYDGRTRLDAMGQERRLLWREDLRADTWDASTGGPLEAPLPALLPRVALHDHLAFLREQFRFVSMLQLSAKGVVLMGECMAEGKVVLIKTARRGTNSDAHGRDAIWALKREHALLEALAGVPGLPHAGTLIDSPGATAMPRPFIAGETFWARWTQADARRAETRAALARAIDQVADTLTCVHARGYVVRDVSAGNIIIAADRAYLCDFELAHKIGDPAPPYRRGTRGFYDPTLPRGAAPGPEVDTYALQVLGGMIAEDPVPPCAHALPPQGTQITAQYCEAHFRRAFEASINPQSKAEAANVYGGISGLLLSAQICGVPLGQVAELERAAHQIILAIPALRHIPGFHFGASGLAVALGLLESHDAAPQGAGLRVLRAVDPAQSTIPDVCQGVAGLLHAALALHAQTGDAAALEIAIAAGKQICAMAQPSEGGVVWPWPKGPYGDLSGAACYGFAHGVAGVVHALLRLHTLSPSLELERVAIAGLRTIRAAARPVPGDSDAVWWPVSAEDATCWNAWCHGTPGIIKTLACARTLALPGVSADGLEAAIRGVHLANNSELCLCHGVASRVAASETSRAAGVEFRAALQRAHAHDKALLARALRATEMAAGASVFADAHEHKPPSEATPGLGLMTGATGALLTLWRSEIGIARQDEFLPI